jgi:hypothetical protein
VDAYFAGELAGDGGPGWLLGQAALESVIAARMAARAVVSMHRALLAGASLAQVADAAGVSSAEAARRWKSWADGQRELGRQVPGLGVSERDYLRAAAVIGADAAGSGDAGRETRIGSPRP